MRFSVLLSLALSFALASGRETFTIPEKTSGKYINSASVTQLRRRADADALAVAKAHLEDLVPGVEFRENEDSYTSSGTGLTHFYFTQTLNGLDVTNAQANVNVKSDGTVLSSGSTFVEDAEAPNVVRRQQILEPLDVLKSVISGQGYPMKADNAEAVPESTLTGSSQSYVFQGTEGTLSEPRANLMYYAAEDGIKLIYRLETDMGDNWMITYADAQTAGQVHGAVDYVADASYTVYKFGLNDPSEGQRTEEVNPANTAASPNGWHQAGTTSYTVTRGNNAVAQENFDGGSDYLNNDRPDGGSSLTFDFPYDPSDTEPSEYIDAAVTQLFYTNNMYHDLLEELGFTEAAGNFEQVNTGTGGVGNDAVIVNAQDGSGTNNANFATPADGSPGRMRMYVWNTTPDDIEKDGDFDAGIVIHEYTHGLSNRLTGGPSTTTCLSTTEAGGMGEGWGDWYSIAIRLKSTDTHDTDYVMADWAYGPDGIRNYPYSTSMTTNPETYHSIASYSEVHAIGAVWAEILYEVLWNLEDKYGYVEDVFPDGEIPSGGRQLAMKLVLEAMKIQPCRPTFLTARDAIIDADEALTGGENACELWAGFAKRGLGTAAANRVNSFTVPSGC